MSTAADLADRVAALERQMAALVRAASPAAPRVTGRVSKAHAAELLDCSVRQVSRLVSRGLLVPLPKHSPNGNTYFEAANVAALVESEAAAREWVARRKFVPRAKRA